MSLPQKTEPVKSENAPFFVDREVIVLTRGGIWLADKTEITHEPTAKLFARSLKKDSEGYYLHIGRETKRIKVEDTAYFVTRMDGDPKEAISLSINDETRENLDPLTLNYRPGRLVCRIKSGQEEARFLHPPYFDLLKHLQEDRRSYYLEFGPAGKKSRIDLSAKI